MLDEPLRSRIHAPLITRWEGEKRVLDADFVYYCAPLDLIVTVPKGFKYDGESIPRWVPILYAIYSNRSEEAAAAHDFGYSKDSPLTREQADTLYLDLMEHTGANPWMRKPKWAGVRLFGWLHFKGTQR